ncbi:MAG: HDIG domain-containing protein [Planctomycetes bacterium]|nr:HDIG domain-containing protein [Planctomycetota bacterium]
MPDRAEAIAIFKKYNQSPSLLRHALAVEAVMRHFAPKKGEDVDYWGTVGLLHDIDYEQFPDQHCAKAAEILKDEGFDDAFIHAVASHGYSIVNDIQPQLEMEKVLFATDELTGLVAAAALMLPTKDVADLKLSSLKKKWKDKRFAAGVNRDIILKGCEMLGLDLDTLMTETMEGMKTVAAE